jgi:hypothetical protein
LVALLVLAVGAERTHLRADLPTKSDRVVSYTIRATLKPKLKEVHADMDLVWRNTSPEPVRELYFHLYLNAFRGRDTSYIREGEGDGKAGATWDAAHAGGLEIDAMRLADGTDLWVDGVRAYVAPDDGNEKDRTLAHVKLAAAVAPGETIALKVEFRSRLPRVLHRTGWSGDPDDPDKLFFMVAQWFPKIAVLRTVGGKSRWNAHQFHRNTEFFADYGEYQVSLTVPKNYEVGATGKRVSTTNNPDGTITHVHRQQDVHDFAWTASPHLVVKEYAWSFDDFCQKAPMGPRILELLERTARHRGVAAASIKPTQAVKVRILYPRDHAGVVDRFWWAAGASLACYGIWFGQYPYEVLTILDPPSGGGAAGGMEYPTLITVFGDRHAPDYATGMEGVTIHEFGHQYFYGLIGSNEFEEAWLDEGFTSYTDARVYEVAYGTGRTRMSYGPIHQPWHRPFEAPSIFQRLRAFTELEDWLAELPRPWKKPESLLPVPETNPFWAYLRDMPFVHLDRKLAVPQPLWDRNGYLDGSDDAMFMPGWRFADRSDYRINSYRKPTVFLYCLRGLMGEEAFDRAMYLYASKHRFKHPRTADFLAAVRAQAKEETRALVDGFMEAMIETATTLDVAVLSAAQREVGSQWEWTIKVQRRGDVPVPVAVYAENAHGETTLLETWHSRGRETTRTFRVLRDRPLHAVRLGPEWLRFVDRDISNNARLVGPGDNRAATVLAARWTLLVEEILRAHAGVGR